MADVNADWVEELRRRVTPDNLDRIAEQLGVLQGLILAAMADGYGGETRMYLEDRVRGQWMGAAVACPGHGGHPLNRRQCIEIQERASGEFTPHLVGLERHCRSGCPNSHLAQQIFEES